MLAISRTAVNQRKTTKANFNCENWAGAGGKSSETRPNSTPIAHPGTCVWKLLKFGSFGFAFVLLILSCGSPDPRVLDIPIAVNDGSLSIENIGDYPEALVAIVSVMVHGLNLPAPQGQVFFYHEAELYRLAITKELKESVIEFSKRYALDPQAMKRFDLIEFELVKFANKQTLTTFAVAIHRKIFVAEWKLKYLPWSERVRVLAHE